MDSDKLNSIIERKNDHLEQDALNEASNLIDLITREQGIIEYSNNRIAEYRARLTALEVKQLDPKAILGGE